MKRKKVSVSIIILLAVVVCTMLILSQGMKRQYEAEIKAGLADYAIESPGVLSEKDIELLPEPVKNYIRNVGAVGKPKVWNFKAVMGGRMRNDDKSAWMNINSAQYNFFENPVRMFYIEGKMFGIPALGLHSYKNEEGIMLIKVLGIIPVVDQRGQEMNQSDTVTILNDMCVFAPASLIDERITWETIDKLAVKATFTNGKNKVSAVLHFNDKSELINFVSDDRYRGYDKARWSTPITGYKKIGEYTLPAKASAVWHMPDREFSYAEFEIKNVIYNTK